MCGKPTTGSLYCSNVCKSRDYYPNLDDTPLLIPSRAQHSLSSSPTSSVMTTLSITDDLPPQVHPTGPVYGATNAQAFAAAFARTSMPPTPGEAPRKAPNNKYGVPAFPSIHDTASPALAPRKHRAPPVVDVENTLHYVRRPAHQRSASSSTTSLLSSPATSAVDHPSHDERTLRNMRKQQRASLPAYFSLLSTPVVAQSEPRYEEWAMPQPRYQQMHDVTETVSVTPTVDRGQSRTRSRSRSRGRTFTRRSSHGAPPLDSIESVVRRGRSRVPRDLEARAC